MWKADVLCNHYDIYLRDCKSKEVNKCRANFQSILSKLNQLEEIPCISTSMALVHVKFLMHAIQTVSQQWNHLFNANLIILNFILKNTKSDVIGLSQKFIECLKWHLQNNMFLKSSPSIISNILWLICRLLKGNNNKSQAMSLIQKSKIILLCLSQFQLDIISEKGICMFLTQMSKNSQNTMQIVSTLIENLGKFKDSRSLQIIFTIIRKIDFKIQIKLQCRKMLEKLGIFLQKYFSLQGTQQSFIAQNQGILISIVLICPELAQTLQVKRLILNKLKSTAKIEQNCVRDIIQFIEIKQHQQQSIKDYLELATQYLHDNHISRKIFVEFHDELSQVQLINIMRSQIPNRLAQKLNCQKQLSNCLKIVICIKRLINRFGLNRLFWYSFKELLEKINKIKLMQLAQSSHQLFQLYEQIMSEQIHKINQL